jgi:hypothetical protein
MIPRLSVAVVLLVAACGPYPDARNRAHERAVASAAQRALPVPPPGSRVATVAESACLNAAVAEGFRVQGIDSAADVPGADGRPVARRIVVRVARGDGPTRDWPCIYHLGTGRAGG